MPASGVSMPLAELTALRVKAPQVGSELTQLPNKLHKPRVLISWDAFIADPLAETKILQLLQVIFNFY